MPKRKLPTSPGQTGTDSRSIQSIGVGFGLIRVLQEAPGTLALKELAAAAGMPPGRAHAYLASFRAIGLVQQETGGERYELGPYALALGASALARLDVREVAAPMMRRFHDATGEGIYLSVWSGQSPVIVSRLDGKRSMPLSIRVGYALPLDISATGRLFLAFLPDALRQLRTMPEHQRQTASPALPHILAEIRQSGLARADSLIYTGFNAVSAPVFDHEGRLAAAITSLGPAGELDTSFDGAIAAALRASAADTSASLGYVSGGPMQADRSEA
jgi:DNA-binding IclR family transcriptional regulator